MVISSDKANVVNIVHNAALTYGDRMIAVKRGGIRGDGLVVVRRRPSQRHPYGRLSPSQVIEMPPSLAGGHVHPGVVFVTVVRMHTNQEGLPSPFDHPWSCVHWHLYSHIQVATFIECSATMLMVVQGGNVKRCSVILDPKECNIGSCIDQCYKQYKGNGVCGTSASGEVSVCYCVYPC
ncbi:hypothetical protein RJ640_010665 [Escallonia rubra]|uniref:Defensin n=1 Tax=Escallonia rubra TaxID=112253 RepID=A0AA88R6A6_9ASTE|nr:hypothetical protein RJ640_010665 [Escallonia rubra]